MKNDCIIWKGKKNSKGYGISDATIEDIIAKRTWKNIP